MEPKPKKEKKKPLAMRDFFREEIWQVMNEIERRLKEAQAEEQLFTALKREFEKYYRKFGEEIVEIDPGHEPWIPECPEWRPMIYSGKKRRR